MEARLLEQCRNFQKSPYLLREHPGKYPNSKQMIEELVTDHEIIIIELRKWVDECSEHNDSGSADLLTSLIEEHENIGVDIKTLF